MGRKSKEKPSFFKVLSCNMDFSKLLRLPPAFLRKYDLSLSENVTLGVGRRRQRRWNVKVEQMENGLLCFSDGWQKFAEDAALQLGEFLVFFLVAKSEFNVVIYETSCCQRDIPPPPTPSLLNLNAHGSYVKRETACNDVVGTSSREFGWEKRKGPLYFEKRLKFHHGSSFYLPAEFSKAASMIGRKHVRVKYVPNQNCQSVAVEHGPQSYRFDLANGWARFRKANKLVFGQLYSFEFNSDHNVIHVNQLK